jgi:hypothetical protein
MRSTFSKRLAAKRFAEKLKSLSFRGTLRAEESLFSLIFKAREIPHFVRFTENVLRHSQGLESLPMKVYLHPREG